MITDEQIQELRERNKLRMEAAKEKLGSLWVLHSANAPKKTPDYRILR